MADISIADIAALVAAIAAVISAIKSSAAKESADEARTSCLEIRAMVHTMVQQSQDVKVDVIANVSVTAAGAVGGVTREPIILSSPQVESPPQIDGKRES